MVVAAEKPEKRGERELVLHGAMLGHTDRACTALLHLAYDTIRDRSATTGTT